MEKFGWVNTIDRLANNDILKWPDVMNVSYAVTITKLELDIERDAFNIRLQKVKSKIQEQ